MISAVGKSGSICWGDRVMSEAFSGDHAGVIWRVVVCQGHDADYNVDSGLLDALDCVPEWREITMRVPNWPRKKGYQVEALEVAEY